MSQWTEVKIIVDAKNVDKAGDIASMVVPYGIYIEDYSELEKEAWEIAHIDLIDEDLLEKDRTKAIVHVYIAPQENPQEAVAFLRERYSAEGIVNEIELNACRNEDWENNWKQYFHPLPIGNNFLVVPSWERVPGEGRVVIEIDPASSFGTGRHETTALCLEALENLSPENKNVLDMGCGSGILGIGAALLGATHIDAIDIDMTATRIARENAEKNNVSDSVMDVYCGNVLTDEKLWGSVEVGGQAVLC